MVEIGLKRGTKCIVVSNSCGHSSQIGVTVTIKSGYENGGGYLVEENGSWYAFVDLKIRTETKKDVESELSKYQDKVKSIEMKLDYLMDNKEDIVDNFKFEDYSMKKILESEETPEEKIKLIRTILK